MGGDDRVPSWKIQNFGYLYLADDEDFANVLRANQAVQAAAGTGGDAVADARPNQSQALDHDGGRSPCVGELEHRR